MENDSLVSDQAEVCNILNDFYINIAKEIGINNQTTDAATTTHTSIQAIKDGLRKFWFQTCQWEPSFKNNKFSQFQKGNRYQSNST